MKNRNRTRVVQMIGRQEIRGAIERLAEKLCAKYSGKTVVIIALLTGAYAFLTHFTETIEDWNTSQPKRRRVRMLVDFLNAASYEPAEHGVGMRSSGQVRIFGDIKLKIRGRHVLLLDDIADTLRTLKQIAGLLQSRGPRSLEVACMLRKRGCAKVRLQVPCHVAMSIPSEYVVGMGLDDKGDFRTLPFVGRVVKVRG